MANNQTYDGLPRLTNGHMCESISEMSHASVAVEEESVINRTNRNYYPVQIGDVFHSRYWILAKLGFGATSTVWLCRDIDTQCRLALKICIAANTPPPDIAISRYLKDFGSEHEGLSRVQMALDDFQLSSPAGVHHCLVFELLAVTYAQLQTDCPEKVFSRDMFQKGVNSILSGMDLLHQAGVVHTDLSANNIMLGAKDPTLWSLVEQEELERPSELKTLKDRTIYLSRRLTETQWVGDPTITNFSEARFGKLGEMYRGKVMPDRYQAPEVILGMEWGSKIDMWSLGLMMWDLFEGAHLFCGVKYKNGSHDDEQHLAEMVSLLDPPPKAFIARSDKCRRYWDADGNWIAATPILEQSLESLETRLQGRDQEIFLAFARKVLRWLPEERASAGDLLAQNDEFLTQFMAEVETEGI